MVRKADIPNHIVKIALSLAASQGWRDTTLGDIADTAKLSLGESLAIYPTKAAIIAAGRSHAEDRLADYETAWEKSVEPAFTACTF